MVAIPSRLTLLVAGGQTRFVHAGKPVTKAGRTELFNSRLAVATDAGITPPMERPTQALADAVLSIAFDNPFDPDPDAGVDAVWLQQVTDGDLTTIPSQASALDIKDQTRKPNGALRVEHLRLTPLGGTTQLSGSWPTTGATNSYQHRVVLGRDEKAADHHARPPVSLRTPRRLVHHDDPPPGRAGQRDADRPPDGLHARRPRSLEDLRGPRPGGQGLPVAKRGDPQPGEPARRPRPAGRHHVPDRQRGAVPLDLSGRGPGREHGDVRPASALRPGEHQPVGCGVRLERPGQRPHDFRVLQLRDQKVALAPAPSAGSGGNADATSVVASTVKLSSGAGLTGGDDDAKFRPTVSEFVGAVPVLEGVAARAVRTVTYAQRYLEKGFADRVRNPAPATPVRSS